MHIAVNGWFIGQQTTGSGQYLHHLLDHLPRQHDGIRISVYAPTNAIDPKWHTHWPQTTLEPVDVPGIPGNLQKVWWEQVAFPRAAYRDRVDVAWTPYWGAPYWQPVPVVVTVHDVIPMLLPAYRGGLQHQAYTRLVAMTAKRSAAVITVSHASAHDIVQQLGIPPERVHVVYHGPNNRENDSDDAATLALVRSKYDLPGRYFLYLGGFDVRKNVRGIVLAYQKYLSDGGDPDVKLVMAGSTPKNESQFIEDPRHVVAECQLEDQVRFPGWIDEADKPALYALATAFVFPSLYEGFGMMALEAMAAGTPVITSAK